MKPETREILIFENIFSICAILMFRYMIRPDIFAQIFYRANFVGHYETAPSRNLFFNTSQVLRYLNGNRCPAGMESTPGTKVKDTQKSVSFLVSNSNPAHIRIRRKIGRARHTISSRTEEYRTSEGQSHAYTYALAHIHTRDGAILRA